MGSGADDGGPGTKFAGRTGVLIVSPGGSFMALSGARGQEFKRHSYWVWIFCDFQRSAAFLAVLPGRIISKSVVLSTTGVLFSFSGYLDGGVVVSGDGSGS